MAHRARPTPSTPARRPAPSAARGAWAITSPPSGIRTTTARRRPVGTRMARETVARGETTRVATLLRLLQPRRVAARVLCVYTALAAIDGLVGHLRAVKAERERAAHGG